MMSKKGGKVENDSSQVRIEVLVTNTGLVVPSSDSVVLAGMFCHVHYAIQDVFACLGC